MENLVCTQEELDEFIINSFKENYLKNNNDKLTPVNRSVSVGYNSELGEFVILSNDLYKKLFQIIDFEDVVADIKSDIGRYVFIEGGYKNASENTPIHTETSLINYLNREVKDREDWAIINYKLWGDVLYALKVLNKELEEKK